MFDIEHPYFELAQLWEKLTWAEKQFVLIYPVSDSQREAARRIGKTRNWLDWIKKKPQFMQALKLRMGCSHYDVIGLVSADLRAVLASDIVDSVITPEVKNKTVEQTVRWASREMKMRGLIVPTSEYRAK